MPSKSAKTVIPASLPPARAISALRQHQEKGLALLSKRPLDMTQVHAWVAAGREVLIKCLGSESNIVGSFYGAGNNDWPKNDSPQAWDDLHAETLKYQLELLRSSIEVLQLELGESSGSTAGSPHEVKSRSVFIVHGHDDGTKQTVARFLEHLDLSPIILHEQADEGRTVIEKFADHSDVAYAVVLLTADDRGGTKDTPYNEQRYRARQNVILELGYFLAKLGRKGVRALCQEGIEVPSDYGGVLFTPLDKDGAWRLSLAKEMKAAGIEIDLNKAVK